MFGSNFHGLAPERGLRRAFGPTNLLTSLRSGLRPSLREESKYGGRMLAYQTAHHQSPRDAKSMGKGRTGNEKSENGNENFGPLGRRWSFIPVGPSDFLTEISENWAKWQV